MHYTATYSPEDNKLRLYAAVPASPRPVRPRPRRRVQVGSEARAIRRPGLDARTRGLAPRTGRRDRRRGYQSSSNAPRSGPTASRTTATSAPPRPTAATRPLPPSPTPSRSVSRSSSATTPSGTPARTPRGSRTGCGRRSGSGRPRNTGPTGPPARSGTPSTRNSRPSAIAGSRRLEADQRKHAKSTAEAERWLSRGTRTGSTLEQARRLANYDSLHGSPGRVPSPTAGPPGDVLGLMRSATTAVPAGPCRAGAGKGSRVFAATIERASSLDCSPRQPTGLRTGHAGRVGRDRGRPGEAREGWRSVAAGRRRAAGGRSSRRSTRSR